MNFAKRTAKLEQSRAASQACGAVLAGGGTGENGSRAKLYAMFPDQGPYRRELYPRHVEFLAAGATFRERLFMAANRTGKTETGAYEMACHLTGRYPDWWQGRRFSEPINAWACGHHQRHHAQYRAGKAAGPRRRTRYRDDPGPYDRESEQQARPVQRRRYRSGQARLGRPFAGQLQEL